MGLPNKQQEFTRMVGEFIRRAGEMPGYGLTLGHVWRDNETQQRYVDKKLSRTMKSKHCDRLAVDVNLFIDGKYIRDKEAYRPLGVIWEDLGGVWGGRFGVAPKNYDKEIGWDSGHFEYRG